MTTAIVYDPIFQEHLTPRRHPESPQRMVAIGELLQSSGLLEHVTQLPTREAPIETLARVHTLDYIHSIQRAAEDAGDRGRRLDPDTSVSSRSFEVARKAAGAPLALLDALFAGQITNGYAIIRPPGHHARPATAMGFCIFNNIAVAARYALDHYGLERVLIVDYDVHHGNGTQEMFYNDPQVLYFSTHQAPFYPGTGASDETGAGPGVGYTVNVPLPAGMHDMAYQRIFDEVLAPIARRFEPELILVSAGYDAHWQDPLAQMRLSTYGLSVLTLQLKELAEELCAGRILLVQEGGYNLSALACGVASSIQVLRGSTELIDTLGEPPLADSRWNIDPIILALQNLHRVRPGMGKHKKKSGALPTAPVPEEAPDDAL